MAFNDTYRESIQIKHLSNVGFTSTAKGVTNEAYALKNPHQVLAAQIPVDDVVSDHGPLTASGVAAGLVEQHTVKLTADPTVNGNKAWVAYEDNCTETGHSARGHVRIDQWMRYAETQYKLRLFEDNGTGTGYDSNRIHLLMVKHCLYGVSFLNISVIVLPILFLVLVVVLEPIIMMTDITLKQNLIMVS